MLDRYRADLNDELRSKEEREFDYLETELIVNKYNEIDHGKYSLDKTDKETWKFLVKLLNDFGYGYREFNFIEFKNKYYVLFKTGNLLIYHNKEDNSFGMKHMSEYCDEFQLLISSYVEDVPDIYDQLGMHFHIETDCDRRFREKEGIVIGCIDDIDIYIKKTDAIAKGWIECEDGKWRERKLPFL